MINFTAQADMPGKFTSLERNRLSGAQRDFTEKLGIMPGNVCDWGN